MTRFPRFVYRISTWMNIVAGVTLTFMMLLTVCDVVLRYLGRPILGSYELVAFSGAIVIGFSLPFTSWMRAHISVDFFIFGLSRQKRKLMTVFTRGISILLFGFTGVYLFKKAFSLLKTGQVSLTLEMPFYFIAFALGFCCFSECAVLLCEIFGSVGGENE